MPCKSCGSFHQRKFRAEIDIQFPGTKNINTAPVLVYPELLVCLDCGTAEFTLPVTELALLAKSDTAENG